MLKVTSLFDKELKKKEERNWDKIYVLVDIHDTIIPSDYKSDGRLLKCYEHSLETLKIMSEREDIYLILWSSCHTTTADFYLGFFKDQGVIFNSFNENPEEKDTPYACFDTKPYFNVLLDDKAGFEPSDWLELKNYFTNVKS